MTADRANAWRRAGDALEAAADALEEAAAALGEAGGDPTRPRQLARQARACRRRRAGRIGTARALMQSWAMGDGPPAF